MTKHALVYFSVLFILGFGPLGCQKQNAEVPPKTVAPSSSQIAESASNGPSIEEAQDDLVGNWRLDLNRSRSMGLKSAFASKSKITMVMEPNGARTLYLDGEPIEQGELVLTELKSDGEMLGGFTRRSKAGALKVSVRMLGEGTVQWAFPDGQRTEVFTRQVVEPSPDFKD